MPSVLWIGLSSHDPDFPLPPNVDPKAVDNKINAGVKAMEDAGYTVNPFLPPIKEGISLLKEELAAANYDAILVGGGLRTILSLTTYFEDIVNTITRAAPDVKIAFNPNLEPETVLEAAQRSFAV